MLIFGVTVVLYSTCLTIFIFTAIVILLLITLFILTHSVNFPCGRKPEHTEKTHDFRQSVDSLFSRHGSLARIARTGALHGGTVQYTGSIQSKTSVIIFSLHHQHLLRHTEIYSYSAESFYDTKSFRIT